MSGEITPQIYNDGTAANPSTIDGGSQAQLSPFYYDRQAVVEANKKAFIGQLSGVRNQPKHMGKTIKKHLYIPLLDDRNVNDQGIDASGLTADGTGYLAFDADGTEVTTGTGWTAATATVAGYFDTEANAITAAGTDGTTVLSSGNLYGSSKDIGTISALTPVISETGGRVNRIGFSREVIESTLENYGFFYEYTQDDLNFDSDSKLKSHLYRESGKAAGEMTEKSLMVDLINNAGIEIFSGTSNTALDGVAAGDKVGLAEIRQMTKTLNANMCPTDTGMITGSRNIDTKVVGNARYAYTTDDVVTILEDTMNATTSKHAWAYVEEYADGAKFAKSNIARGEVGKIGKVRFIEHPEMLVQENKGTAAIDVHPILFVGSGSFTQIGFQANGSKTKFEIITKMPGKEIADRQNPYGKVGFTSNNYWYGVLVERPDWLGCIYTAVE